MKKITLISTLIFTFSLVNAQSHLPDVVLHDVDGKEVKSSTIGNNGRPFAICFWAIWNKTSLLELNNLMSKYDEWHKDHDIDMYAVSIDHPERIPRAKEYIEAHHWKYNVLFDENGDLEHQMKIIGVPHLILFDKDGKIVWQEHEYHSGVEEEFIEAIKGIE